MSICFVNIKRFIASFLIGIVYLSCLSTTVQADNWVDKGNLNTPRFWHTATLLNNGKVLIVGGESNGNRIKQTEIYDPATGSWSYTAFPNYIRKDHTAHLVTINKNTDETRVLILGGSDSNLYTNTSELYNPSTNTWMSTPNMSNGRLQHASSILEDGNVLVTGGYNPTVLKATEIYDPILNTWSNKASLTTARRLHTQVTFKDNQGNSKVMVIGGLDVNGNQLKSVEIYDPSTDTWSLGSNMNSTRFDFSAIALHDGRILVVGGNSNNDNTSEIYNPVSNSWTVYSASSAFKYGGAMSLLGSGTNYKVIVAGGVNSTNVQLFDPSINQWSTTISLNSPRSRFTLTTLNDGNVLAAAGLNPSGQTNTSEVYTPDQIVSPTPTATPTPSASPTPAPFLELPFDYQSKGKTFEQIAFNPESWFDHKYPLQNFACCIQSVLSYSGNEIVAPYRSHAGYDYALRNGVGYLTPVTAAASGSAEFKPANETSGLGNTIKIDHGNGYQTWYGHLDPQGLIVATKNIKIPVAKGQEIGKTGYTGNIFPQNQYGAHIHFSVYKDITVDGSFKDDYPYGLNDLLGWEGDYPDPWTQYGTGGTQSYNLFLARAKPVQQAIPTSGATLDMGKVKVEVPEGASPVFFTLSSNYGSFESDQDTWQSIVPSFFLKALDTLNNNITQFFQPITLSYNYSDADLQNIKENSIAFTFYNEETKVWEHLPTTLDTTNNIATAQTTHFSHFALMGEVKDKVAPTTEVSLQGDKGQDNWYRSSITIDLQPEDNEGGLGVESTLYTLNGSDWSEYTSPVVLENEGNHKITYQSIDKAHNLENQKTVEFHIDKTPPEVAVQYDTDALDFKFSGKDTNPIVLHQTPFANNTGEVTVQDKAGNITKMQLKNKEKGEKATLDFESLQYDNDSLIDLSKNRFLINYVLQNADKSIKKFEQKWWIANEVKLQLNYLPEDDLTEIKTKEKSSGREVAKVSGLKILKITTDQGALHASY